MNSPEIAEMEAPVAETGLNNNQQLRPFAWGNRSKPKIGPNLTSTSSKLVVQSESGPKRLMKNFLRTPSQTKLQSLDNNARPIENDIEEAIVSNYGPVPQP